MAIEKRARTGIAPDGKRGYPGKASKFLTHKDQLEVIEKAKQQYKITGKDHIYVSLNRDLGKIYLKGGKQSLKTKIAKVSFDKNGKIYTAFPVIPKN